MLPAVPDGFERHVLVVDFRCGHGTEHLRLVSDLLEAGLLHKVQASIRVPDDPRLDLLVGGLVYALTDDNQPVVLA